ncbi:diaminopimelate epimerase, partial [Thermoproteota archaeon]
NGARCLAYYVSQDKKKLGSFNIETMAGLLKAQVTKQSVKINMTGPNSIKLNLSIKINGRNMSLNFVNTGVPHAVIFCDPIESIDVHSLGRLIRFHSKFSPAGTNVNFIEPVGPNSIKIRTYERGVEGETLACGTGSVAAAIIYALKLKSSGLLKEDEVSVDVITASGEVLKVCFDIVKNKVKNVWLNGKANLVYKGECHV